MQITVKNEFKAGESFADLAVCPIADLQCAYFVAKRKGVKIRSLILKIANSLALSLSLQHIKIL